MNASVIGCAALLSLGRVQVCQAIQLEVQPYTQRVSNLPLMSEPASIVHDDNDDDGMYQLILFAVLVYVYIQCISDDYGVEDKAIMRLHAIGKVQEKLRASVGR